MEKTNKKAIWSWSLYDWANSAYSTTVMAGFFPVFFKTFWSQGTDPLLTTARLGTAISVSSLLVALASPTLGAVADLRGYKKLFCMFFMVVGVISCGWMTFIQPGDWFSAILAYSVAMMAFNASCVFYDSLLPFIARGKDVDYASSLGYSLGYLGGGVLFTVNVLMYLKPELFGLPDGVTGVKLSFTTVAVWWFVFSLPLAKNVKEPTVAANKDNILMLTQKSLRQLKGTLKSLMHNKNMLTLLVAYWLYIDGVYTVMTMAVDYGISLGFAASDLITALLITQYIGFPFALLFGVIAKRFGCRGPILVCIGIYSVTVILSTQMTSPVHFYILAAVIGMAQGGVQALSRSLFARMIDPEASGEYFGLFNLVGKFASIIGPLVVAIGVTVTGNARASMLGLLILFVLGGILLWKVKEPALEN
jgi:Permeases of the major facilitator superfamily